MIDDGLCYNHHLEQVDQWFPYNGWRYKVQYDIKLNDGMIMEDCYPNGNAWYMELGERVEDVDVAWVKIRDFTKSYIHEESTFEEALAFELCRYKDDPIPERLVDYDGDITYVPVKRTV